MHPVVLSPTNRKDAERQVDDVTAECIVFPVDSAAVAGGGRVSWPGSGRGRRGHVGWKLSLIHI